MVSPDTPSAAQLVVRGQTGVLCAKHSASAYAAAISALIADPQRCLALGNAAPTVSLGHDWDTTSAQVEDAYSRVLAKSARLSWRAANRSRQPATKR